MRHNVRGIIQLVFNYAIVCLFVFLGEVVKDKTIIHYSKLVALALMALNVILFYRSMILQKTDIIILLHTAYVVVITMLFGADIINSLASILTFPVLYVFFDRTIKNNSRMTDVIYYSYLTYLIICVFAHLFTDNPLAVGGKNQLSLFLIPLMFFAIIHAYKKYNRLTLTAVVIVILSSVLVFIHRSGTGIVAMFLALLSLCFLWVRVSTGKLKRFLLVGFISITIALLALPVMSDNYYIKYFMEGVLNKDVTMSGRMEIWDYAVARIKDNPFGYGQGNTVIKDIFYRVNVSACHNSILEVLMIGGVPLLILYIGLLKNSLKNNQSNKLINFSYAMLFAIAINGLTESIPYTIGLWLVILTIKNLDFSKIGRKNDE